MTTSQELRLGDQQKRLLILAARAEEAAKGPAWCRTTVDDMPASQVTARTRAARRLAEKGLVVRRKHRLSRYMTGGLTAQIQLTVLGRAVASEFADRSLTTWRGFGRFLAAHTDLRELA